MKYDVIRSYWPAPIYSDGSTLDLDFTTGVLDSRLTFTRAAGTATYINSSGYVTSATANTPRFDYSPTNIGEPRGLLVEGQAINLCTYSQAIAGAGWNTTTGYTVTTNTTDLLSPYGDNTATKLVYTSGYARCIQTVNLAANTTYTMSYWIKSVMAHTFRVYDLTAGADIASSIGSIPVTSSWTRVQKTCTTGASTSSCWFYVATDGGPTAGMTAYVWGAQVELGSGASSYIPTGASQVTRNADDCYISGSNFTSWFDSTQGTLLVTARSGGIYYDTSAYDFAAVLTQSGTGTDHIGCAQWSSGLFGVVRANNTYNLNYTSLGSLTAPYKAAIAYAASDFAAVANNGTVTTGTGSLPLSINRLRIGGSRSGSAPAGFSGQIASIKYYPTRLPNAQLQALTAP